MKSIVYMRFFFAKICLMFAVFMILTILVMVISLFLLPSNIDRKKMNKLMYARVILQACTLIGLFFLLKHG